MSVQSYVDVREVFKASIKSLVESAKGLYDSVMNKGPSVHYKPKLQSGEAKAGEKGWDGDLFKLEDIGHAFSREEHKIDVQKAIKSPTQSGTVGDLVGSVKQGDYLAVQERAFRMRHVGRVRAMAHAGARYYGHQHEGGLFQKGVSGEVASIVRRAKNFRRKK